MAYLYCLGFSILIGLGVYILDDFKTIGIISLGIGGVCLLTTIFSRRHIFSKFFVSVISIILILSFIGASPITVIKDFTSGVMVKIVAIDASLPSASHVNIITIRNKNISLLVPNDYPDNVRVDKVIIDGNEIPYEQFIELKTGLRAEVSYYKTPHIKAWMDNEIKNARDAYLKISNEYADMTYEWWQSHRFEPDYTAKLNQKEQDVLKAQNKLDEWDNIFNNGSPTNFAKEIGKYVSIKTSTVPPQTEMAQPPVSTSEPSIIDKIKIEVKDLYNTETPDYAIKFNAYRQSKGLQPLIFTDDLNSMAQSRLRELKSDFSHNSPGGYNERLAENIVMSTGSLSNSDALLNWQNSPRHNANMLNGNYKYTGYAGGGGYAIQLFTSYQTVEGKPQPPTGWYWKD